jgi:uncharacterized protein (UPF0332 family)
VLLSRASQELDAARVLADNDFPRQAASRAEVGRLLSDLFAARGEADYGEGTASEEAVAAIADAERFVDAVRGWIDAAT